MTRVRKRMKRAAASSSAHLDHGYPAAVSALEVKRLQEKVNHLAVEVFHLTTELDEVRHLLATLVAEAAVPPSQPSPSAGATIPERAFTELPADIGLECFPSEHAAPELSRERQSASLGTPSPPLVQAQSRPATRSLGARQEPPRQTGRRRAPHVAKVTGLAALLVVGLGRVGDPVGSVTERAAGLSPIAVGRPTEAHEHNAGSRLGPQQVVGNPQTQQRLVTLASAGIVTAGETAGVAVSRFGLGTGVVGYELIGRSDTFRVGTAVVFWTHLSGGQLGDAIHHLWFHDGRQMADVVLPVNSPSWRTHSRYTLPGGAEGDWTVELRDPQDRVLAILSFRCEG